MLMVAGNSMAPIGKVSIRPHCWSSMVAAGAYVRTIFRRPSRLVILLGQYMQDNYLGRYYAKAQNLARTLRAGYDEALKGVDLLLMPTLPLKATVLPPPDASREVYVARALEMLSNTCPFDVTGHPAITVPAGLSAGLPVGMMLIGRHWEDGTVLRAADAFQKIG
jgi:amidase